MGNCQAVDNATLLIQHPSGRVDKLYLPVAASEIMKTNPGHYVALLLTTTLYSSPTAANKQHMAPNNHTNMPVRITRIKLLRPTDTLALGHVYRLVTTQEVMKGLWAKKQSKMRKQDTDSAKKQGKEMTEKTSFDFEAAIRRTDVEQTKQVKQERHRSRNKPSPTNCAASKSRAWQPSLHSISEAGS